LTEKKNLFKLAQGEYIRPEHIEGVLKQNKFIANAYVHGDSLETYLVAIIVPDFESLKIWANSNPQLKSLTNQQLVQDSRVVAFLLQQIDEVSKSEGLKGFEMVKKIHVIPDDFSADNGLLTPTMKLKRNIAAKLFEIPIKNMYATKDSKDSKDSKQKQIKSKL